MWLDVAGIRPVRRVVLEQQRVEARLDEVVDRHDFDVGGALDERLERLATDPAEAVDFPPGLPWFGILLLDYAPPKPDA